MDWLTKRLSERSTYIGLATTLLGVGTVAKINEAPEIAGAIEAAATPLSTGDYTSGLGILLMGVLGIIMRENR